ncbi:MAG: DUF6614 family protein [Pseudomonadota bacterium]
MNLYHCFIELKRDTKALAFAQALEAWMTHLKEAGKIGSWRLLRRKMALSSDSHGDFMLEIEVTDLAALDQAFRHVSSQSIEVAELFNAVHQMIAESRAGLYRPFPDPERAERVALI